MAILIEEAVDSGHEPLYCYAEGHHAPEAFLKALYAFCDAYEDAELTEDMVYHTYVRNEPNPDKDDREYLIVECDEWASCAYPITKVDVQ